MNNYKRFTEKVDSGFVSELDCRIAYNKLVAIEDKIESATNVKIYYESPYKIRYAIVEYYARKNKPLQVVEYSIYGEELKTGEQLICWEWVSSTNFSVKEDGFKTEAEAKARLKEIKNEIDKV